MIGAILGDMIGAPYEFDRSPKVKEFPLFSRYSEFTDDSVMTIAVADALMNTMGKQDEEIRTALVDSMRKWGKKYPDAGYGGMFYTDNELLGKLLYVLAHCPLHPEFRISYFVKDPEAAKNELLGNAVSDAKEKADVLTKAAGIKLMDIQSIDYSWGEINLEYRPMAKGLLMEEAICAPSDASSYDMNIEPDDIEVSDTVTVIWELG